RLGDNVVWQIDNIEDYIDLVRPFVKQAVSDKKKVIYMRFASHKELVGPDKNIKRYELDAHAGFESFATRINNIITEEGEGAYYIFDCLSDLLSAWATDLMIGDFFMITCPYLYELKTVTYFSLMRNSHSFKAIARIRETTQLLIDVYHSESSSYVHPLKVWNRYSPTMFLPHQKKNNRYIPITDSVNAVKILSYIREKTAESAKRNLDYWDRLFIDAEELIKKNAPAQKIKKALEDLCRVMITKNKKMLSLAIKNFSLEELIEIKARLIGAGFIGGKSAGMLLARKILSKNKALDWQRIAEPHDSFYIGSDIFYSYIVHNRWWKLHMQQKSEDGYFSIAKVLKEKMLYGVFPEEIMERFQEVVEYFGASPIIVRSSSLLEDDFGNAFAGKYESVFLANQGSPEQRFIQFTEAVRKIYASTMNEDALVYRKQRGLDKSDEQMALLVQRVSGAHHKDYFFPDLAGVGVSYNTYVWDKAIDPHAGMLRLVFGLGTRSVNRVEGDYPRMVALDEPLKRPYSEKDDIVKYSQHDVDLINTSKNIFDTVALNKLIEEEAIVDISRFAAMQEVAPDREAWVLTMDALFKNNQVQSIFKKILKALEEEYDYPVEIEYTINFSSNNDIKVNLLQCRPLQTKGLGQKVQMPAKISKKEILFDSSGYFLGGNISQKIQRVIYVDPQSYTKLNLSDKYEVARIVGRLNVMQGDKEGSPTLLMGPGRWGTTTPSLGIP
ncbi:MAG TPA: PEP/pyruvate-binding domain-containing protein, partial [Candidatus Omnitrophota bacterium]|nr:PEP/pyruvate-binding domain-containing protein [Candidatus Omnitrophota bacterium]